MAGRSIVLGDVERLVGHEHGEKPETDPHALAARLDRLPRNLEVDKSMVDRTLFHHHITEDIRLHELAFIFGIS